MRAPPTPLFSLLLSSAQMSLYPPRSPLPTRQQTELYLQLSIDVADKAAAAGHHPFGALLLDEKGERLMEQGNISTVEHAEVELARRACMWIVLQLSSRSSSIFAEQIRSTRPSSFGVTLWSPTLSHVRCAPGAFIGERPDLPFKSRKTFAEPEY